MINAVTDIQEDTLVELVINSQPLSDEDVEIRPHSLTIHSYKTPTFCHFCGEMLFGMFKQVSLNLPSTLAAVPAPSRGFGLQSLYAHKQSEILLETKIRVKATLGLWLELELNL